MQLPSGIHTLYLHVRSKGPFAFTCNLKLIETKQAFQALSPAFLPDLVNGKLFSRLISVPIMNLHGTHWLKVNKVSISKESSSGSQFTVELVMDEKAFVIAPGQVRPVKVALGYKNPKRQESNDKVCNDEYIVLKISTNKGQDQTLALKLRCRKLSESFLFTFLDHDGSVQHAATIAPLKSCLSGICPVLLTLHGTSKYQQNFNTIPINLQQLMVIELYTLPVFEVFSAMNCQSKEETFGLTLWQSISHVILSIY